MVGDSLTAVDRPGGATKISAVHPDIIQTHILTRLDGSTLASAGCASSHLHRLTAEDKLWQRICNQTWPSTADPLLRQLISTFSAGHRSFYSDSFPALHHHRGPARNCPPPSTLKLISAVDINYQNKPIYSKVVETETAEGLFQCSPFQVDLLDEKNSLPLPANLDFRDEACESDLEKNLTLSWILIDPIRKRAAKISSARSVFVDRNWLTGDIQIRFATVICGDRRGEAVVFVVIVTCGGSEGGDLEVKEVSFQVENVEGKKLAWKESLGILEAAMEGGERRREKKGEEERERYEEFLKMKMQRILRKRKRETTVEMVFVAAVVATFMSFLAFLTFKFLLLLGLV